MRSPPSQDVAVSPAIGTILLVAMTVIFVALVAVVVMGLSSGMFDSKQVGLTLKPYATGGEDPAHGIGIIVHGGADAGDLVSLSAVITGPKLIYSKTKNNTVPDPQVGPEYRMAAFVDPAILDAVKKGSYTVNLITTGTSPVAAMECYATVTGKFRDGTEQVLLIQKVLIPAIPGTEGSMSDEEGLISVVPYYISDTYPAHGFKVTILKPDQVSSLGSAFFKVPNPSKPTTIVSLKTTKMTVSSDNDEKSNTYDITTTDVSNMNGWAGTPYPDVSKYWVLGTLTGNVSVTVTLSDSSSKEVTVGPIMIPPRVNFFVNPTKVAGNLSLNGNTITVTFDPRDISVKSNDPNFIVFYSNYHTNKVNPSKITNDDLGKSVSFTVNDLEEHRGENLEVFVLADVNPTQVWYRVSSYPVNNLL